jgi:hypothetical protein
MAPIPTAPAIDRTRFACGRFVLLTACVVLAGAACACDPNDPNASLGWPGEVSAAAGAGGASGESYADCAVTPTDTGYIVVCTGPDGSISVRAEIDVTLHVTGDGAAGAPSEPAPGDDVAVPAEPTVLIVPETDGCDDELYAGAEWGSSTSSHFVLWYIENTAAHRDASDILSAAESAYSDIRAALGISAEPVIDLILSPNRLAADYYDLGKGVAYGSLNRIEAVYPGSADSYLTLHPGYLLTQVLLRKVVEAGTYVLPFLATGLGEYLDGSDRDLHLEYAYRLVQGAEAEPYVGKFGDSDVWGDNPGMSGSFMQFMAERYGMAQVTQVVQETSVSWLDGGYVHSDWAAIDSAAQVEGLLADVVEQVTGEPWETATAAWRGAVLARLEGNLPEVPSDDRSEIVNLVAVADHAMNTDDAALYRATMEGFYCDWLAEEERQRIAYDMVTTLSNVETTVLRVYPRATRNFATAHVVATRSMGDGNVSTTYYIVEHFETGWRIASAPEWP